MDDMTDPAIDFYTFFLLMLSYHALKDEHQHMTTIDQTIADMTVEDLQIVDKFLTRFYDYLVLGGVL